jgi:dTDP-glucose 4,6-dehydratase
MFKKILITGSEGFIGSHVTELFVKQGFNVRALVYYNSFNSYGCFDYVDSNLKKKINFIFGDVRNYDSVLQASKGCDIIIHLAALIGIPYSYITQESYLDTNVKGTLNVLQAARQLKISRIILTSTSEVYGSAQYIPINESHPINPQSPYAASKVAADAFGVSFYKSFNLPVTILRPFNTFGPRQSSRAIIPTIINQIVNNNKILNIGNLYPTRDFTYVEDLAKSFLLALRSKKSIGRILNIGSNFEISIKDLASRIIKITNSNIKIKIDKSRKRAKSSEVSRLYADTKYARNLIKWKSFHKNDFNFRLKQTIDWFKEHKNQLFEGYNKYIV